MGAPKTSMLEVDLTTRVPSFPGAYGAIVIPAKKGPIDQPVLVENDEVFLQKFTPDNTVKVGYNQAYFSALSFLRKSNKLWVMRACNADALYGGVKVGTLGGTASNAALGTGETDPTAYTFASDEGLLLYGANPGVWNNSIAVRLYLQRNTETFNNATGVVTATGVFTVVQEWASGEAIKFTPVGTGTLPAPLVAGTTYYTIKGASATTMKLASSFANAIAGTALTITEVGTGTSKITPIKEIGEPGAFLIEVYKTSNTNVPVETHICHMTEGHKDGYGRNIYVETVLEGSEYIRAFVNPLEAASQPLPITPALTMTGGTDGTAVVDADMVTASNVFDNPNSYPVTILMDGGWATPAYQVNLKAIAESRQDCVAVISTPFDKEATATYLNDIVDYRKNILNIDSSYVAMYSPHVKILDRFNNRELFVSPDGFAGGQISFTAGAFEIWYPVGGSKRGRIDALDLHRRFSEPQMDVLYDAGINPIEYKSGKGIRINGQKTLQSRPSDTDRLNVRCLLIVIKPAIKEALDEYRFELNDPASRSLVTAMLESYLDGIVARRGIKLGGFYVECSDKNNTAADEANLTMNVHVFIKPVHATEYIPCSVVLTPGNIEFSVAAESV